MSLTGKKLGDKGRYELRNRIGGGGMAEVYCAQDTLLEREVAVKILRGEFVTDADFINRFRREAQAAARLQHPNIVSIYDVGMEGTVYYIVMEYVDGDTLKERLSKKGPMTADKALSTALQIALALQHAHANGIIHCDIKPHNILIDSQGTVKVTDFGIARAVSSATMAHTSTIMGSVHYIAPEQVQGTGVSKQSDVYSLGVVMYEMLTGKVPFFGETPVSVALKHIQEEPPGVKQVNPEVPAIVDAIVAKAMEKSPANRYGSIDDCIHDIKLAKSYLKDSDTAVINNDEFVTQIIPRVGPPRPTAKTEKTASKASTRGRSKMTVAFIIVLIMAVGFSAGMFMAFGKFWSASDIIVPDVTGRQIDIARNMLLTQNLRVNIEDGFSATVPLGCVISQYPEAGISVKEQRAVTLVVSKGGENTIVPDLKGLAKDDAVAALKDSGLDIGNVKEIDSDQGDVGTVVAQSPVAGTHATKGQKIDIDVIKTGGKKLTVPDLTGMTQSGAQSALSALKLKIGKVSETNSGGSPGAITAQQPAAGTAAASGSAVDITVVSGKSASKSGSISYTVPAGADNQSVTIVVSDSNGSRTVYDGTNHPGDTVNKSVSGVGSVNVQVLLNGSVVKDVSL